MTGWHAPDDLVARYTDGSLPESDAWSLEKHVERCGSCAARVSHAVRSGAAGTVLAEVRDAVLTSVREPAPAPSRSAVLAARAVGGWLARIVWAAGPAVRGSWAGAVVLVAVGAVALTYGGDWAGARPLLLAVAPVVPVAGVALSYGRHADPLHEIVASTPSGGLRLLLMRTAAVLAVSLPTLTVAALLLPGSGPHLPAGPTTAGWLLPGLTLTLASLVLSAYVRCRTATTVIGGGWLFAVTAPLLADTGTSLTARLTEQLSLYFSGAPSQGGWAAATALCALLLAARRTAYNRLETM
ncbi:zf-HC2 domain-containing protein [Streptomyces sp. NPDC002580]|uniref:zf-HC2 domain-containing protein n=1 Tax=Streptomyces sp. NPDC002580 TaxID=3364653 RepID=UPI0036CF5358